MHSIAIQTLAVAAMFALLGILLGYVWSCITIHRQRKEWERRCKTDVIRNLYHGDK